MAETPEIAKEALDKLKNKHRKTISNESGDKKLYRRVSITLPTSEVVDNNSTTQDISLIAEARSNVSRIIDGDTKVEELTYKQKQGVLFFLNRYLNYLSSAALLKTKFMSTSLSFTLPDDLRIDSFQKQTIIDFHKEILDKAESLLFNVFLHYCLYGTSFILCADNWNQLMRERFEELESSVKKDDKKDTKKDTKKEDKTKSNKVIKSIYDKLTKVKGLDVEDLFRFLEKNPSSAMSFFKDQIHIEDDKEYKKLSDIYSLDPKQLSLDQLDLLRKKAFPLIEDLNFFEMGRALNPARYGEHLEENIDTDSFEIEVEKSDLLMKEEEFLEASAAIQDLYSKHPGLTADSEDDEFEEDEEVLRDIKKTDRIIELSLSKLVFKGYSRSWVEAHLYPESDLKSQDRIKLRNDSYKSISIFRIKNQSLQEDMSNADSLIESAIDLLNCEIRQRSWINDNKEKLIVVSINANASTDLSAAVIDGIVEDIAYAVGTGESNIIAVPEGISLEDNTAIIRASNDTEKLESQAKNNIALFFNMSTSMLEDSEAEFSNTFLKIDTAQNVFTVEREAISRMIEDKLLKPASVKAGFFCKNSQGKVVIAYPRLKFNRISIGRASEDYNEIKDLVDAGTLPKDMLYSYHNTSKEEVSGKLVEDALSIENESILTAMVNKLVALMDEDETGEIIKLLLKNDTLGLMARLKKTPTMVSEDGEAPEDEFATPRPETSTPEYSA